MNRAAPRSIDAYLKQLRDELADADPALAQDALYDAEEYLRAEIAAHPGKSEADVLELIASTYGAPDEVAAAYRETEAKVAAALHTPKPKPGGGALRRFFAVYSDPRAYASLFYLFLALALGIFHFVFAVVGVSLSVGFAVLIIGVPFFIAFIGLTRVIALADGRLVEAVSGERMPRRPRHPGPRLSFWARVGAMLRDTRTWTTLAYFVLSLPLGIAYFVIAVTGLALGLSLTFAPVFELARRFGWIQVSGGVTPDFSPAWLGSALLLPVAILLGIAITTALMHLARFLGRAHARFAKHMLVIGS
ncbi:MAG: sensor domain-containing protein [Steroidobacteraceae bacterium]